jgi:hypothetical protein
MNAAKSAISTGLSALNALLNGGTLVIYSGGQPATPETALSGQVALLTYVFTTPAFGTPAFSGGYMQALAGFVTNTVTPGVSGTAGWARSYAPGAVAVCDYTVGTTGTDVVMTSTAITSGTPEVITSMIHKMPAV